MTDPRDKFDELASGLDDLQTTIEELQVDPPEDVATERLEKIRGALEEAGDAADDLEEPVE